MVALFLRRVVFKFRDPLKLCSSSSLLDIQTYTHIMRSFIDIDLFLIITDLKAPHVPGVAGILEAVLVALEEKLQLEPATILIEEHSCPESRRRD